MIWVVIQVLVSIRVIRLRVAYLIGGTDNNYISVVTIRSVMMIWVAILDLVSERSRVVVPKRVVRTVHPKMLTGPYRNGVITRVNYTKVSIFGPLIVKVLMMTSVWKLVTRVNPKVNV